jgi:hypothetical protein
MSDTPVTQIPVLGHDVVSKLLAARRQKEIAESAFLNVFFIEWRREMLFDSDRSHRNLLLAVAAPMSDSPALPEAMPSCI